MKLTWILALALLVLVSACMPAKMNKVMCGKDFSETFIQGIIDKDLSLCQAWLKENIAQVSAGCYLESAEPNKLILTRGEIREKSDRYYYSEPFADYSENACLREIAVQHKDFEVCEKISISPEEWEVDFLRFPEYVYCYTKVASLTGEHEGCDKMNVAQEYEDASVSYCKELAFYANMEAFAAESDFCQIVSDEIGETNLIKKTPFCIMYVAEHTMNAAYCEKINDNCTSECSELLDRCYFKVGKSSFDKEICNRISDASRRQQCISWKDEPEIDILEECRFYLEGKTTQIPVDKLPVSSGYVKEWCKRALE